jgi:hypothetical protein
VHTSCRSSRSSAATLGRRKLAEFGKVRQYSQRLKASAVRLLDLKSGHTVRAIQLVRQKVGNINGYCAIETRVRQTEQGRIAGNPVRNTRIGSLPACQVVAI